MKRLLFILVLLFISLPAFCSGNDQLGDYYKYIYLAEKNVLHADYKDAVLNYDKAFNTDIIPFGADVYNNMLAGINTADNARVLKMAKLLILKGVDISYFRQHIFTSFRRSKEWKTLLREYPSLKAEREKTIDKKLVQQLKDMVDADQSADKAHIKDPDNQALTDAFQSVEDSLYKELKNLMINNDYLSEEKTGIETNDTEINFEPDYNVIITHSFEDKDTSLLEPLKTAIHTGKLKSGIAMNLLIMNNQINYLNDYHVFKDTLFAIERDPYSVPEKQYRIPGKQYMLPGKLYKDSGILYLLSKKPTKAAMDFSAYCYMDTPETIVSKVKYAFQYFCDKLNGTPSNPDKHFYFGPENNRYSMTEISTGIRNNFSIQYEKMVAVYRPLVNTHYPKRASQQALPEKSKTIQTKNGF